MRQILNQMQEDPRAVQEYSFTFSNYNLLIHGVYSHLKNPMIAQKLNKLISAGIIRVGH